jgi:hypothetical protein
MGRGMGSSTWGGSGQPAPPALSKEDELKGLKDQANEMRKQIEGIEASINALEKK